MNKPTHKELHDQLLSLPEVELSYPFGEGVAVYKTVTPTEPKMFALVTEGSDPIRLSLKCDPQLSLVLREKYESVMPGYHLNKKHWNTILLTGQLTWDEVVDLINLSHRLVRGEGVS